MRRGVLGGPIAYGGGGPTYTDIWECGKKTCMEILGVVMVSFLASSLSTVRSPGTEQFTQVVWKDTTHVAMALSDDEKPHDQRSRVQLG